tara:strand:+ start:78 stop:1322 length:1245 start_codon:yes stop_codon:yes gene_type:complete
MANTFTVGRLSFTSPRALAESSMPSDGKNSLERNISINGTLVADSLADAKNIRDELISLSNSNLIVPFTYEGDSTYGGYCQVDAADVNTQHLFGKGLFKYSLNLRIKGRAGETSFESNLTGGLLTNAHSYTSSNTYGPLHALPVNAYNYAHSQTPTAYSRSTKDGTVYLFSDQNLRSSEANWQVAPENYYKGGCKITIDNYVKNGYLTKDNPNAVVIDNGLVQVTSGSVTNQSRLNLKFYDNGEFVSAREVSFSMGSSLTEWNKWKSVQILRNDAEEASIRLVTYSETAGDGRLTVDLTIRRGMHHVSFVATQSGTANRSATSRINLRLQDINTVTTNSKGFTENSIDSDGQKFFVKSPQGITASASDRTMHIAAAQFKGILGYIYGSDAFNGEDAIFEQYMESTYEQVRLVRS